MNHKILERGQNRIEHALKETLEEVADALVYITAKLIQIKEESK